MEPGHDSPDDINSSTVLANAGALQLEPGHDSPDDHTNHERGTK
jgi:hypothetical protein